MKAYPPDPPMVARPSATPAVAAAAWAVALLLSAAPLWSAPRQVLMGHVPRAVTELNLQPVGRQPAAASLDLIIGLPLRNRDKLTSELHQIYDPASPMFRQYLTPAQFTERFGPTEEDYQALVAFARANNLAVVLTHPNRTALHVRGAVADVEKTFHMVMRLYRHPVEDRTFYAPDVEPSLDLEIAVQHISGLDDLTIPRSTLRATPVAAKGKRPPREGSGPGGLFSGNDFRAAYAPGTTLTGSGQAVGIMAYDGYYLNDIRTYETNAGLPNVPIQNVFLNGFTGTPSRDNTEVSLDMEMAIAMAPGMSQLTVYAAPSYADCVDVLNEMVHPTHGEPLPNQLSTSFAIFYNPSVYQAFQQMARQGQSFFAYSGDSGAYTAYTAGTNDTLPFPPGDCDYVTCVGGTVLTTSGPGGPWVSETTWPWSGGGPSPWYPPDANFALAYWQAGMDMSANRGSTTTRNCPDVAMVADNVLVVCNNGSWLGVGGTSAATPLWAGFAALVNQQAAAIGQPPVGFMNPAIYAIGRGLNYASCFHDITSGNNTHGSNTNHYYAVRGYDLCTGWGTPAGQNLIDALTRLAGAIWVDFNYTGSTQNGKYETPFRTLAAAVNAVASGGLIALRTAGSSPEMLTISEPMQIIAAGGPATVGR